MTQIECNMYLIPIAQVQCPFNKFGGPMILVVGYLFEFLAYC